MASPLYVLGLEIDNFLRVKAVTIHTTGPGEIEISGENGQGKSSVLDAIWAACGGADKAPARPIRRGQERASIAIDLGQNPSEPEFTVRREWWRKEDGGIGTKLVVLNAEGFAARKPQETLSAWLRSVTMDPLAFVHAKPDQQAAMLREISGLDTRDLDADRARTFEQRTTVNRQIASLRGELDGMEVPESVPEPIDIEALLDEDRRIVELETMLQQRTKKIAGHRDHIGQCEERIANARSQMAQLQAEIDELSKHVEISRELLDAALAEPPIEVPSREELRVRLREANAVQAERHTLMAKVERAQQLKAKLDAAREEADGLTARMKAVDERKRQMVADCQMPLDGLAIEDGQVIYRGEPLSQASTAEQIEVAMAIAAAQNPRLRVVQIRDGSLLDKHTRARVLAFAQARALQVWIETVETTNPLAFVIEDGSLQAAGG